MFKDKPMYVRYTINTDAAAASPQETEGVLRLVSFELVSLCHCTCRSEGKQETGGEGKTAQRETEGVAAAEAI